MPMLYIAISIFYDQTKSIRERGSELSKVQDFLGFLK